ncbi:MAG: GGDEF domain-containing protein [Spirochaetales bacterium]|nr:GGDEF domain-containing protein [Spirochaetales bacterium]
MNDKIVIFIRNELEEFSGIIKKISEIAPFGVEFVAFEDITTEKYNNILRETLHAHVFFGIAPSFYKTISDKFDSYLKAIFQVPFSNLIFIYQGTQFMNDHTFILGKSICFYFSTSLDSCIQANYFTIYQLQLFEKAVISNRLSDYITETFKEVVYSEILVRKNKEIENLYNELEEKNRIDYLTSLYNRKALFDFLERERKRTLRDIWRLDSYDTNMAKKVQEPVVTYSGKPQGNLTDHLGIYSVLMIDIDNFKSVNDKYGHLVGDVVLRTLGDIIINDHILRENDVAGRFGGEEFIIILPETNSVNALGPALRLAEKFKNINFSDNLEGTFSITLSIGISEYHPDDDTNDDIIRRADKALYYAKKHGKGKVIIYEKVF